MKRINMVNINYLREPDTEQGEGKVISATLSFNFEDTNEQRHYFHGQVKVNLTNGENTTHAELRGLLIEKLISDLEEIR